jgi:hypothetical protein
LFLFLDKGFFNQKGKSQNARKIIDLIDLPWGKSGIVAPCIVSTPAYDDSYPTGLVNPARRCESPSALIPAFVPRLSR